MQREEFLAMGCRMSVITGNGTPLAATALAQAPGWFAGWEQCLSRFRPDSELNALNRFAGDWFTPSDTLWQVLCAAQRAALDSDGLVVPTLLDALEAAGYDRDFDAIRPTRQTQLNTSQPAAQDWRAIELDPARCMILMPRGMRLDLAGIAKGWAADETANRLAHLGGVLVDAGGDLAVRGTTADGAPWPVGVTDPRAFNTDAEKRIDVLMLSNVGVATSGTDYRYWHNAAGRQHHILDPRTGQPARTNVLSATVIATNTFAAEVAAKCALILGGQAGMAWADARSLACCLVMHDGTVRTNARFERLTWRGYSQTKP